MPFNKYFAALGQAFYSRELYREAARRWKGAGFLFLFFLLALAWIPTIVEMHLDFSDYMTEHFPELVSQVPKITIEDGEVSTDVPMPYEIRDPETDVLFAVIDLTGEISSLDDTESKVLLTKTHLYMQQGTRPETRVYDLRNVKEFTLTQDDITDWGELARQWLVMVFYLFAVPFSLVYRILQALLYAAIGLAFARGVGATLSYDASLRLAVLAITPPILLDTLRDLASVTIPLWWFLSFLIAMGYLYFGVHSNAEEGASPATPPETPISS
jgi:hypothetical protein